MLLPLPPPGHAADLEREQRLAADIRSRLDHFAPLSPQQTIAGTEYYYA
jgi:hypothetical protein